VSDRSNAASFGLQCGERSFFKADALPSNGEHFGEGEYSMKRIAMLAAFAFVLGIGGQAMADCSLKPTWGCVP
jgi:hypothetical protein